MESFDDIIKKGDEQRARREQEEQRRLNSTRERLESLVASFEQSLETTFKVMLQTMGPNFEFVALEHSPPALRNGVLQTRVTARAHTESVDISVAVQLGAQPGDGINLGVMHVGELHGEVSRRKPMGSRKEPFAYKFCNEVIVTPHCGVDPTTLQFNISQAIKRLVEAP